MNEDDASERAGSYSSLPWLSGQSQQTLARTEQEVNGQAIDDPRRVRFVEDLIKQIDMVIHCQISVLYYMDCSTWTFLLRLIFHWSLPDLELNSILPPLTNRARLAGIFYINIICIFLHLVLDPPRGDELSRGYVHGTFLIDFVGEPSPASKWKMMLIDLLILGLQLFLLSAVLEKRELKLSTEGPGALSATSGSQRIETQQDLDAEEQGIRRSQDGSLGYHMPTGNIVGDGNIPDGSYSGEMIVLTVNPVTTIRKAWQKQARYGPLSRVSQTTTV